MMMIIIFSPFKRPREHDLYEHPSEYDRYGTPPPPPSAKHSSAHHAAYESSSYERDYRREYHPHSSSYAAAAYAGKFFHFSMKEEKGFLLQPNKRQR